MVTFIFTFDLRSGQVQVKKGQILKGKFSFKTYLFCSVLSQDSEIVICFAVRQLEIPKKNQVLKNDVITFNRFWATSQPKINILA